MVRLLHTHLRVCHGRIANVTQVHLSSPHTANIDSGEWPSFEKNRYRQISGSICAGLLGIIDTEMSGDEVEFDVLTVSPYCKEGFVEHANTFGTLFSATEAE